MIRRSAKSLFKGSSRVSGTRGQVLRFLMVGGIATFIDLCTYLSCIYVLDLGPSFSKRFSFVLGSFWAFFMHRAYTFQQTRFSKKQPFLFVFVYAIGWVINSLGHDLVLKALDLKLMAYGVGTGLSTLSNFILQKYFVFQSPKLEQNHDRAPTQGH